MNNWQRMKEINAKIERMLNLGSAITRKAAEIRQAIFDGKDTESLCLSLKLMDEEHRALAQEIEADEDHLRSLYKEPKVA